MSKAKPWWSYKDTRIGKIVNSFPKVFLTTIILSSFVGAAVAVVAWDPGREIKVGKVGQITEPPTMEAVAQGCAGVTHWEASPKDEIGALPDGEFFDWRVTPPVSGNFASKPWTGPHVVTLDATERPTPEQALALTYRGWVTVWYRVDANPDVIRSLISWARNVPADAKILVAPWTDDATKTWRADRTLIVTGWDTTQPCLTISNELIKQFREVMPIPPGLGVSLDVPGELATESTYYLRKEAE